MITLRCLQEAKKILNAEHSAGQEKYLLLPAAHQQLQLVFFYIFIYIFHKQRPHLLLAHKKKKEKNHIQLAAPVRDEAAGWKSDNPNTNEKQIPPESHLKRTWPKVGITHSPQLIPPPPPPPLHHHHHRRSPCRPLSPAHGSALMPVGSDEARPLAPHFNFKLQ